MTPTPDPHDHNVVKLPGAHERDGRTRPARATTTPAQIAGATGRVAIKPAVGSARAVASMFRYWRAERRTLRQGMVSLSVSALGNIPTGLALGAMTGRLEALPGLFLLIPAAIGMRGAIFGALGSRLGTSLNAGMLRFTKDRQSQLMQNIWASTLLTFITSLAIALSAWGFIALSGRPAISVWSFLVISVLGGLLSSAFVLLVTVWLAYVGSKRDWDLDSVAAPLITFVGDLITMPSLFLATFLAEQAVVTTTVGIAAASTCLVAAVLAFRTPGRVAKRIVRESVLTLIAAGMVNVFAGAVIDRRIDGFIAFPALLVMLPPFLENAGALGGIVSSRLASKLHLGAIEPKVIPERLAALDISLAAPWSLLNFGLTGITAHLVATWLGQQSPGALRMTALALIAGAMATAGAAIVAYATAVATFRFNLDPDNHGIAAVTSTMDLIGVLCIVATVALLGVR